MKVKGPGKILHFEPDNTYDAFQLGRLYEKTQLQLDPGVSTGSDKATTNALIGVRFDAAELVGYLLRRH